MGAPQNVCVAVGTCHLGQCWRGCATKTYSGLLREEWRALETELLAIIDE